MTVYYFHIRDERGFIEDVEGIELPDVNAALEETLRSVNEFTRDTCAPTAMQIEIADAAGRIVLKVPLQGRSATAGAPC